MRRYTFDIGGMGIKFILFDNQKKIDSQIIKFEQNERMRNTISFQIELITVIEEIKKILNLEKDNFELAILIPGIVDSVNKQVLSDSAICNVNLDLPKIFSQYKNCKKFIIENDARAALIGEYYYRNDSKIKTQIHLTIGTALGVAMIINNKIYKGNTLKAGEIGKGFFSLSIEENLPIVAYCGVGAVLFKYKMATKAEEFIDGKKAFSLYEQKDPIMLKLFEELVTGLTKLIINLDFILDYDLLTLGGGISNNEKFVNLIKAKLNELENFNYEGRILYQNLDAKNKVEVAKLKNEAACYGGMYILENGDKIYE
ncbi:ROK family protein [Spiroplasma cantharicola]|uniref:Transcriptional regulator/sugar kinase n=1 Tax=Spiroplasma cantharicola TaxID=362837 RepID=A0A0M3SJG9_9MOLU|nr:ROK family protein [Spiroplasma cantharicola]ALD66714.1 transcriptional regulator/sugar kinase [Spiroplasma cantharicola]